MTTSDSIRPTLHSALAGSGLVLEDVVVTPAGRRRVVKVLLDRDLGDADTVSEPSAPLSLDEVADATRLVSEALDDSDVMGEQPYTLEVTSRGVDRPLTLPRHWRRNADRLVKVTTTDGETVTGRIVGSSDDAATLELDGTRREVAYADVAKALVQVEFNRKTQPDDGED